MTAELFMALKLQSKFSKSAKEREFESINSDWTSYECLMINGSVQ